MADRAPENEHFAAEELTRWRDRAMRAEAALAAALRALQAEIVWLTGNKQYAPIVVNGVEMHFRDAEDQGLVTP